MRSSLLMTLLVLLILSLIHVIDASAKVIDMDPVHPLHHSPLNRPITSTDTHLSSFPSVQIHVRSPEEQQAEIEEENRRYDELSAQHKLDVDGNPINQAGKVHDPLSTQTPIGTALGATSNDPDTVEFLERASTTLASVMQHDSHAIYHFKSLVARGKLDLAEKKYDSAATLFREASKFYFDRLRQPYAKIATTRALGETLEHRIAAQLEAERGAGVSTANTAAQQFREKELQNQPHVHSALLEYQESLKQTSNAKAEKKASAANAAKVEAAKRRR